MTKQYDVIVVDPPWKGVQKRMRDYVDENGDRKNRWEQYAYPQMSDAELRALDIGALASGRSYIFCWAVQRHLEEAFGLVRAWGFKPLLTMGWTKTGAYSGRNFHGFRWNLELIVVGRRGGPWKAFESGPTVYSGFAAKNNGHSQKPDEFYRMVEHLGPNRLDIFARKTRPGWDVWGNEVETDVTIGVRDAG